MQTFKYVNQHTRAGKNGKEIYCSYCNDKWTARHFSWIAFKCNKCNKFVDKYEWKYED